MLCARVCARAATFDPSTIMHDSIHHPSARIPDASLYIAARASAIKSQNPTSLVHLTVAALVAALDEHFELAHHLKLTPLCLRFAPALGHLLLGEAASAR